MGPSLTGGQRNKVGGSPPPPVLTAGRPAGSGRRAGGSRCPQAARPRARWLCAQLRGAAAGQHRPALPVAQAGAAAEPVSLVVWRFDLNDKHARCAGFARQGEFAGKGGERQRESSSQQRGSSGAERGERCSLPRRAGGEGSDVSHQDRKRLRPQPLQNTTAPGPFCPSERAELADLRAGLPAPEPAPPRDGFSQP